MAERIETNRTHYIWGLKWLQATTGSVPKEKPRSWVPGLARSDSGPAWLFSEASPVCAGKPYFMPVWRPESRNGAAFRAIPVRWAHQSRVWPRARYVGRRIPTKAGQVFPVSLGVFLLNAIGKTLRGQVQLLLQKRPLEPRARVGFATGGNVFVSCNVGNRIALHDRCA